MRFLFLFFTFGMSLSARSQRDFVVFSYLDTITRPAYFWDVDFSEDQIQEIQSMDVGWHRMIEQQWCDGFNDCRLDLQPGWEMNYWEKYGFDYVGISFRVLKSEGAHGYGKWAYIDRGFTFREAILFFQVNGHTIYRRKHQLEDDWACVRSDVFEFETSNPADDFSNATFDLGTIVVADVPKEDHRIYPPRYSDCFRENLKGPVAAVITEEYLVYRDSLVSWQQGKFDAYDTSGMRTAHILSTDESMHHFYESKYNRDSLGYNILETTVDQNGKTNYTFIMEYDSIGNMMKLSEFRGYGDAISDELFTYDNWGRQVKMCSHNKYDDSEWERSWEYDDRVNKIFKDQLLSQVVLLNEQGDVVKSEFLDYDRYNEFLGSTIGDIYYKYDGHGNWVDMYSFEQSDFMGNYIDSTHRIITYYDDGDYFVPTPQPVKTITCGNREWIRDNLKVTQFRNGDQIPQAQSKFAWWLALRNHEPAWCYGMNADSTMGYEILYNYYAIKDERGLAPEGMELASWMDWQELIQFLGGEEAACRKIQSQAGQKLFTQKPTGHRNGIDFNADTGWWTKDGYAIEVPLEKNGKPNQSIFMEWRERNIKEKGYMVRVLKGR